MNKIIKLRAASSKDGVANTWVLPVPVEIARMLIAKRRTTFGLAATEDGLVFRPLDPADEESPPLPSWLAE